MIQDINNTKQNKNKHHSYTEGDTVEFDGDCGSQSLSMWEYTDASDIDWTRADSVWYSSELSFVNDNNMLSIEHYFDAESNVTYVNLDATYYDENIIEFDGQWNGMYNTDEELILYILFRFVVI